MPQASHQQPPESSAVSKLIDSSGAKSASEALTLEILHNLRYQHDWTDLQLHVIHLNGGPWGSSSDNDDEDTTPPAAGCTMVNLESDSYFSPHYQHQHQQGRSPSHSPTRSEYATTTTTTIPSSTGTATTTSTPNYESSSNVIRLISGLPPRHSYIHPDLQLHLLKHSIPETSLPVQREFVLPLSTAEKWTLSRFCAAFDALSERERIVVAAAAATGGVAAVAPHLAGATPGGGGTRVNGNANRSATSTATRARAPYEHKDQKRVLLGMRAREGGGGDGTVVYYIMQEGEVKPRQNG
jgi:tRNA-splicing endonuclease subunit Sen15